MSVNKLSILILLVSALAAVSCISCSAARARKNCYRNTTWKCVYEEFLADAGTMTITVTLEFVSAKEYVMKNVAYMPPYPAMYMNPDGSVDMNPGFSSEHSSTGTYKVGRNEITLTEEDGGTKTLILLSGKLVSDDLSYQHPEFTREPGKDKK